MPNGRLQSASGGKGDCCPESYQILFSGCEYLGFWMVKIISNNYARV